METTGIIGTAKNTGKTTTLSFLLNQLADRKIAVTGIGYDGEEIDTITSLPKPRLHFDAGVIVATAEQCLQQTDAGFKVIHATDIYTSLGRVLIAEVTSPGMIVIAGPNRKSQLKKLMSIIEELEIQQLLIDGSLNRMSPMHLADKIIFTTGCARSRNIETLVEEMKNIEKIFEYPKSELNIQEQREIVFFNGEKYIPSGMNSLFDRQDAEKLIMMINPEIQAIYFSSFVSADGLSTLMKRLAVRNKEKPVLIFQSPMQLLISCELGGLQQLLENIAAYGAAIQYLYRPELTMITVNPFYPIEQDFHFVAGYVDKAELLKKMQNGLRTPVYNVMDTINYM